MRQEQFLTVASLEEARARWEDCLELGRLPAESVALADCLGRVVAEPLTAPGDVPAFDRSNVDGFAVRAVDTFGAAEADPIALRLLDASADAGVVTGTAVEPGTALPIATGGVIPRGADAVLMVELGRVEGGTLHVTQALVPGERISQAGSDIARGETLLHAGTRLTARETGTLAACGLEAIEVVRRPRVGILSTGDEIVAPGTPLQPGQVHDANATLLAHAVTEIGGESVALGIAPDDAAKLREALERTAPDLDMLLLSGGTSKGQGDLTYRVLESMADIVVHGVALKPGKPLCLGVWEQRPVAVLPGFPTSAIFTFHAAVAPVLRRLAGTGALDAPTVRARLLRHQRSERGRTEFCLVSLVAADPLPLAVPLGKGSGSVTTFARADGFFAIPTNDEFVEEGATVEVTPIAGRVEPADLVVVGSHCVGLDVLVGEVAQATGRVQVVADGSMGGVRALAMGAADLAPVHLFDADSETWNVPFASTGTTWIEGYRRTQGLAFRAAEAEALGVATIMDGDREGTAQALRRLMRTGGVVLANRSPGSGTRILIETLLEDDAPRPDGWTTAYRTHTAVAASIAQGRSDFGVCLEAAARGAGLAWLPWADEHYDFLVRTERADAPAVRAFLDALAREGVRESLMAMGFTFA